MPTAGRIVVDGRDITRLPPEARGTAMMFQSYALWPHMTVAANIGYGLRMRGKPRDEIARRVGEMLKLLQLEGYGERTIGALSGGQQQRVALGRALAVDPSVLLLDEPMSNLDYRVRLELRHELRALQQRVGITAIYVTHDREEALTLADRIAVIDAGRIAQLGTPDEVFHRPVSAVRRGLHGRRQRDRRRPVGRRVVVARFGGAWRRTRPQRTSAPTRRGSPRRAPTEAGARSRSTAPSGSASTSARSTATASTPAPTTSGSRTPSAARKARRCAPCVPPEALLVFPAAA